MYLPEHPAPTPPSRYVSTGRLPVDDVIVTLLESAHGLYAANSDGELSQVYPVLAQADSARYGLAIGTVTAGVHAMGAVDPAFTLLTVPTPFAFVLVSP